MLINTRPGQFKGMSAMCAGRTGASDAGIWGGSVSALASITGPVSVPLSQGIANHRFRDVVREMRSGLFIARSTGPLLLPFSLWVAILRQPLGLEIEPTFPFSGSDKVQPQTSCSELRARTCGT